MWWSPIAQPRAQDVAEAAIALAAIKAEALKQPAQVGRRSLIQIEGRLISATGQGEPRLQNFEFSLQARAPADDRRARCAQLILTALVT